MVYQGRANYAGQRILLRSPGLTPERITRVYLAGGFANYINVELETAPGCFDIFVEGCAFEPMAAHPG